MPTTFDICVEHLATQYFGLVTISGVASSHRMGGGKVEGIWGGNPPVGSRGFWGWSPKKP